MREEIKNLWEQAKVDLKTAKNSFKSGDYYASVFWCQQSLEKAIKSNIILCKKESHPNIHSLIKLGKIAGITKEYEIILKNISPEYYITRYPDASGEIPYKLYKKEDSIEILKDTEKVLKWISIQM